mmetsp:Transcript_90711/g.256148  ORF Transcript_90711/g.256148 Transcript_90711/m.256148 type:complete len:221 (+) Transcript_90711:207-869(+)
MRKIMCSPESVDTISESSPTRRAKDASSKAFCIFPRPKEPRSPPFFADPQSECSRAKLSNFARRSPGSRKAANLVRNSARNLFASSCEHVILGSLHEAGRREFACLRIMCNTRTSAGPAGDLSTRRRFASSPPAPTSPQSMMATRSDVFPVLLPTFSILFTTSKPDTTFPKTTCFPSKWGVGTVQMKNCDPFVLAPELAIDKIPGAVCLILKFSSLNFSP